MSAGDILHHGITDPQVERLLEVRVFVVNCVEYRKCQIKRGHLTYSI